MNHQLFGDNEEVLMNQALTQIEMDTAITNIADQKYMYSEVTYADEFELPHKLNLGCNRVEEMFFFEILFADGKKLYRCGPSLDYVLEKYPDATMLKQIKQDDYAKLRLKANQKGDDN